MDAQTKNQRITCKSGLWSDILFTENFMNGLWFGGLFLSARIECRIAACCSIQRKHWGGHSSFLSWSQLVFFQLCLLMARQRVRIRMTKNGCFNKIGGYRKKTMPQRTFQILLEKVTIFKDLLLIYPYVFQFPLHNVWGYICFMHMIALPSTVYSVNPPMVS